MNHRSLIPIVSILAVAATFCFGQAPPNRTGRQVGPVPINQPRIPEGFQLDAAHQKYLDQILGFWEKTTSETKRYRCTFRRWEYDGKPDAKTFSEGTIQYSNPDKGLFQVSSIRNRVPPKQPGGKPEYVEGQFREHWVCDGASIFEFDHTNKQLKQRPLPAAMRGARITDGPLPFLFGAKAKQIKERLWLRVVTPDTAKGEYHLEGLPKTMNDAANFERIVIILAEEDFLPKGMILHHRDKAQTTFLFENRDTNWNILAEKLNLFHRQFYEPKVPVGWRKVVEPIGPRMPNVPPVQQARQPNLQLRRR